MLRAQLVICVTGMTRSGTCEPPTCHSKRIGNREVQILCPEECSTDVISLLDKIDENSVKILHNICTGAGGCAEANIEDSELCCTTRLEVMPGLRSLGLALGGKGVSVTVEKGLIRLCVKLDDDVKQSVEKMRDAFVILESVYDTQRRIAEGVAKSISSVPMSGRTGRGERKVSESKGSEKSNTGEQVEGKGGEQRKQH